MVLLCGSPDLILHRRLVHLCSYCIQLVVSELVQGPDQPRANPEQGNLQPYLVSRLTRGRSSVGQNKIACKDGRVG